MAIRSLVGKWMQLKFSNFNKIATKKLLIEKFLVIEKKTEFKIRAFVCDRKQSYIKLMKDLNISPNI